MSLKVTGLDELQKELKRMADRAKELDGSHKVPVSDLLTDDFMSKTTEFLNAQEMFDSSGFKIESQDDFAAIPDDEWDAFISKRTSFSTWQEMLSQAAAAYAKRKIGL